MKTETLIELLHSVDRFDDTATVELRHILEAVDAGLGDGKLTIEIAIKKDPSGALLIEPRVKGKRPALGCQGAVRYRDDDGNLVDEDPRQGSLLLEGGKVVGITAGKKRAGN